MTIIDEIVERLKRYPQIHYQRSERGIRLFPATEEGFEVSLAGSSGSYTVAFKGWHEEFDESDKALNCFAFGLSEECRLKETSVWSMPYKWTVEQWSQGEWVEDSTTGLLIPPIWELFRMQKVRYFQNHLIPLPR